MKNSSQCSNKKLRVAMIAPPFGALGGPEVVCAHLTEALIKKGVDVTLFAPGDWKTSAKHIKTLPKSLWNMSDFAEQSSVERRNLVIISQLDVLRYRKNFDIIHTHSQRYAASVAALTDLPCVITLHNKIRDAEFRQLQKTQAHIVATSKGRKGSKRTAAVIPNGIPVSDIPYSFDPGSYLIVVGRLLEQKGIDTAIAIAMETGRKLLIFGRIGNAPARQTYYHDRIEPFLNDSIIYMGEASQKKLLRYVKGAEALLCPIRGGLTVFPLVVMEALSCGTPIFCSEITGFKPGKRWAPIGLFTSDMKKIITALKNNTPFDRKKCREFAETYLSSSAMANDYLALYEKIVYGR